MIKLSVRSYNDDKDAEKGTAIGTMMHDINDLCMIDGSTVWVNLTNGVEVISALEQYQIPYRICRFQSTAFEQKNWGAAIDSMPDEMLLNLAVGKPQTIIDFGANHNMSRAMRQGIPIAAYIIASVWGIIDYGTLNDKYYYSNHLPADKMLMFNRSGDGYIVADDIFKLEATNITKRQKARIKYFKRYMVNSLDSIEFNLMCGRTEHDGDYDYYASVVKDWYRTYTE